MPLAPGTRSVTPVGRLNNMVRQPSQHRRLPLPTYLPTSCVPRLTYRRLLPHGCCTHTYRLPARCLTPTNAVVQLMIPAALLFLVDGNRSPPPKYSLSFSLFPSLSLSPSLSRFLSLSLSIYFMRPTSTLLLAQISVHPNDTIACTSMNRPTTRE